MKFLVQDLETHSPFYGVPQHLLDSIKSGFLIHLIQLRAPVQDQAMDLLRREQSCGKPCDIMRRVFPGRVGFAT